ncbi:hypothetical protein [Yoonia sp. R78084]|uniref:hypothetical protein n=1 Tax=Yoonia sp. R78084 TaxID=3093869 RepID=UPI0037DC8C2C
MKDWLAYLAAFGIALASATVGHFVGFWMVMSSNASGLASLFAAAMLIPLALALAVFIVSYAAFSDRWLGWANGLIAATFVVLTALVCFMLIANDVLEESPAAILLVVILFFGGRYLLKRASFD